MIAKICVLYTTSLHAGRKFGTSIKLPVWSIDTGLKIKNLGDWCEEGRERSATRNLALNMPASPNPLGKALDGTCLRRASEAEKKRKRLK